MLDLYNTMLDEYNLTPFKLFGDIRFGIHKNVI